MGRQIETFNGFIGQPKNVRLLKRYITNAKQFGKPLANTLLTGTVGSGKTQLAKAIASEFGTTFHSYCVNKRFCAMRLADAAKQWNAHDIVFVDEVQSLDADVQELFCRVMVERKAPKLDMSGPKPRLTNSEIDIPAITLIAGTDQPGRLLKSFSSRFSLVLPFDPYTERELRAIVAQTASRCNLLLSAQAARLVAAASRGNPRWAVQRVELLRDYYGSDTSTEFTAGMVKRFLRSNGVEPSGMTREDRRYIEFLNRFGDRETSLRTIALGIHADERHISSQVEPWLIRNGWVGIAPSGRYLTQAGKSVVEKKGKEENGQN